MIIAIAADHGGFPLKAELIEQIKLDGHDVIDLGPAEPDPRDDYPDYARMVGQKIQNRQATRGIVVCGSGVGACVAANKMTGIRAGLCHDSYSAHQGVEHDDMNVLCLGARIIGASLARELATAFTTAEFSGQERHKRRLNKVLAIEADAHATPSSTAPM